MSVGDKKVQFVCVRPAHHRRCSAADGCQHLGLAAYCPAGEVGDHDWMPTSTDLATLMRLGFIRARETDLGADEREERDDMPVLIRT